MATKEQVEEYCAEQWRKLRAPGDWRAVAERFWRWGESKGWSLQVPWQGIVYDWLVEEKGRQKAKAKAAEAGAERGRKTRHVVHLCMLCWRPFCAPRGEEERDWVGCMGVCDCEVVAARSGVEHAVLHSVDKRGGRTSPPLCYEERPAAGRLMEDVQKLKARMLGRHGDELEERQREWHAALEKAMGGAA